MSLPSSRSFLALTPAEVNEWLQSRRQPAFRAKQLRRWIYCRRADSFLEMDNLPQVLRRDLAAEFQLFPSEIIAHQRASDGTEKLLLELHDGERVECVLMREEDRRTVCISSQVGCAMGCVFCASGLKGLERNLHTAEILEQVLRITALLPETERLTNLVVMGIGEPLANLAQLLPALEQIGEATGLGMGARRITISTVGLPAQIRKLAAYGKSYNLAISLHAPNDTLRSRLVPVNARIGIDAILEAAEEYFEKTGRRVTFEYVLLSGLNDGAAEADELGRLLAGRRAHVNLIPMNGVSELEFVEPTSPRTGRFAEILQQHGVVATVRKRKGADIDAACGQLRLSRERQAAAPTA